MQRTCKTGRVLLLLTATGLAATACYSPPPGRVALRDLRKEYGLTLRAASTGTLTLANADVTLWFTNGSRRIAFNGVTLWLHDAAVREHERWHVAKVDATNVLAALLAPAPILYRGSAARVLIDPGHGGQDTGALSPDGRLREQDIVYDVGKRVVDRLVRAGVAASLSREARQALTLAARSTRASRQATDLFVSIHANSAGNRDACGVETFLVPSAGWPSTAGNGNGDAAVTGNRHELASLLLAYHVHRQVLDRSGAADRGIKRARFDVLADTPCPAVLVECGFLSSPEEASRLGDPAYRQKLADGIAAGVQDYARWIAAARVLMLQDLQQPRTERETQAPTTP